MTTLKPPNGARGWIALALIVLGGSTGGSYLRPAPAHNPAITTAAWVQMVRDVENLRREIPKLKDQITEVLRRLPPQQPREQP